MKLLCVFMYLSIFEMSSGFLFLYKMSVCKNIFMKMDRKSSINYFINDRNSIQPRTDNQREYVEYLVNRSVSCVVGIGPAGCGKTMFACNTAINELKCGAYDKIIVTRPLVPVDAEEIGFLPGNIVSKMDPWTRPIFDVFSEVYSNTQIKSMMTSGTIEISPLAFMRGRTFKRAFIIADEMQNSSPTQMKMLLTRVGEGSKMIITGDLAQSDRNDENGLSDFYDRLLKEDIRNGNRPDGLIRYIEMDADDVQRSNLVKEILDIYSDI